MSLMTTKDVVFCKGPHAIFQVALAIFKLCEENIMMCEDMGQVGRGGGKGRERKGEEGEEGRGRERRERKRRRGRKR
eukprot:759099-Hanusia_phi.AAC.1